ncbi:hypothetical protein WJX72_009557 [[Myrmecia] bisecta]|uniref:CsbD-like domain-containing protein n=1 Tax=[Myrmecia] bisecta TaxID=41462 RepID=A0AAW1R8V9_9CHLO
MTGSPSKTAGKAKEVHGAVKQNVGAALGADKMEAKGAAKRAEGDAETTTAKAKGYAEGATDSIVGGAKNLAGKVLGNEQMQAEGKARQTKGDAKKASNE